MKHKLDPRGPVGFDGKVVERNGQVFVFDQAGSVIVIYKIRSADRC